MSELKAYRVKGVTLGDTHDVYLKSDVDKAIADLEESHKKEVEQLLMKISGLEKLVETANKLIKQKGGFKIKDVAFGGAKLEGINTKRSKHDRTRKTQRLPRSHQGRTAKS